jgi:hypothetical protein
MDEAGRSSPAQHLLLSQMNMCDTSFWNTTGA